ncbi:hypothetical protein SERLA73DRAFT_78087 [Serpula lacrymans var. lacrymans S7.3]|uniref:Uncharacterized protein n=1 Tax=Serpula lacrymans var. lacrymans (strain S7.3) TaxID=936435 RepID=F8QC51_SERL3|nr:hypothetical protein SERLA73DRAFT_78087 [Serpula lacrymans var. lacrymans S7.3]
MFTFQYLELTPRETITSAQKISTLDTATTIQQDFVVIHFARADSSATSSCGGLLGLGIGCPSTSLTSIHPTTTLTPTSSLYNTSVLVIPTLQPSYPAATNRSHIPTSSISPTTSTSLGTTSMSTDIYTSSETSFMDTTPVFSSVLSGKLTTTTSSGMQSMDTTSVVSSVTVGQLTLTTTFRTTSTLADVSGSHTGAIVGGAAGGAAVLAIIILSAVLFMRRRAKIIAPSTKESTYHSIGTSGPHIPLLLRPSPIALSAIEEQARPFGINLDSHNSLASQPQPRRSSMLPSDRKEDFAMSINTAESNIINGPLAHATLRSPLITQVHYEEYRASAKPVDNSFVQLASHPSPTVPLYWTEDDLGPTGISEPLLAPVQSSPRLFIAIPSYRPEPSSRAESNNFHTSPMHPLLQSFPGSTSRRTEYDPRPARITGSDASNYQLMQTRPQSSLAVQLSRTGNQVWHGSTTEPCPPSYSFPQPSFQPSLVAPSFRTADSNMPIGTAEFDLPAYSSVTARSRQSLAAPSYSTTI